MKNNGMPTCPGCGRHCSLAHPRCKYGRDYWEKIQRKEQEAPKEKSRFKWEGLVEKEGLIWQLFLVSRSMKKALRKKKVVEEDLLLRLNDQEQQQLSDLLKKLDVD